jgi:hypothetical protein
LITSSLSSGITSDITLSIQILVAINSAVFFVSHVNIITSIPIECNLAIVFSTHGFGKSSKAIIQNISLSFQTIIGVFPCSVNSFIFRLTSSDIFSNKFLLPNFTFSQLIVQTIHCPFISSKLSINILPIVFQ